MPTGIKHSIRLPAIVAVGSLLSLHASAQGNRIKAISDPRPPQHETPKQVFPPRDSISPERPEVLPVFKGSLREFFAKNLKYPEEAKKKRKQGQAMVQFVVEATGLVTDVRITKSSGDYLLDEEALRVIGLMQDTPYWTPGVYKKKPVAVLYVLPVKFQMDQPKHSAPKARVVKKGKDTTHK